MTTNISSASRSGSGSVSPLSNLGLVEFKGDPRGVHLLRCRDNGSKQAFRPDTPIRRSQDRRRSHRDGQVRDAIAADAAGHPVAKSAPSHRNFARGCDGCVSTIPLRHGLRNRYRAFVVGRGRCKSGIYNGEVMPGMGH
jgi:hypothetical protein